MSDRKGRYDNLGYAALFGVAAAGIGYLFGKMASENQPQEQQQQQQQRSSSYNDHINECSECCVCLSDMDCTTFPCGHSIHTGCANRLKQSDKREKKETSRCPICRKPFKWEDTR